MLVDRGSPQTFGFAMSAAAALSISHYASTDPVPDLRTVRFGEAIPLCYSATRSNERFAFGSLGGRYTLLGFLPSKPSADHAAMMEPMARASSLFDAARRVVALASNGPDTRTDPQLMAVDGSLLVFHDQSNGLHDVFGVTGAGREAQNANTEAGWFLIDPTMRIMATFAPDETETALDVLERTADPLLHAGVATPAPVMMVPRVFEPGFCEALLDYYAEQGGKPSGVTRERGGKTLVELDNSAKKRSDCMIEDETLRQAAMHRIYWRLAPEIEKAFQFKVTRMERYIVCCYDAESGGYFKAHRDNTTKGTAHRRFAVSINLNAEDFDGGGVVFPEYSDTIYSPPTGGALIFSCSVLHEALPITGGKRFAFLPFLYDDAAAEIRRANNAFLDQSVGNYQG
jgi:predicted 2-oxoglutarate/Fe(II)-dependent dioxygenase YbiX